MTPMIDIVFLLIIFFLVSSHLARQENSIPLELPNATTAIDPELDARTITLQATKDGIWQGQGKEIDLESLPSWLGDRQNELGEALRVRIRVDRALPYQTLIPVLQGIAKAGISDLTFAVYEEQKSDGR